jgi:RecB family exonuclease
MSPPSGLVLIETQDSVRRKDSINPVSTQYFYADSASTLVDSVVSEIGRLPVGAPSPALIVESSLAAQSLKLALAAASWPGREAGAPMPWCGTLNQAVDQFVAAASVFGPHNGLDLAAGPRAVALRRAQLAQQLLDRPGLRDSLGGSARAALGLAGQWIELFEGWEWLEAGRAMGALGDGDPQGQPAGIAQEVSSLKLLHDQNRSQHDKAAFIQQLRGHPQWQKTCETVFSGQSIFKAKQVWFCLARTPTAKESAMAQTLWSISASDMSIWKLSAPKVIPAQPRQLVSAQTLEETAWVAAQTILQWRKQGIDDIGIVPFDRKAVRRLRALLERAGEPFNDRSGWALDTTIAASAVAGLAEMLTGRATTQSVLEWMHGPFVAPALTERFDFGFEKRRAADAVLRQFGRIAPVSLPLLNDLCGFPVSQQGSSLRQRQTIRNWALQLLEALQFYTVDTRLSEDPAGMSVLSTLQQLAVASVTDEAEISAALWHAVLAEELSRGRFSESLPDARVRICSMDSLLWRQPKALMLVGADPSRFPEKVTARFFEPRRFAEMGLALAPEQEEAESYARFLNVWSMPIPLVAIAQSDSSDAEAEFSRWIALAAQDSAVSVTRQKASEMLARFVILDAAHASDSTSMPDLGAPLWPARLPSSLSVSALQSLKNCPYQFFAERLLGLGDVEDLSDETNPSDVGSCLHLLLSRAPNRKQTVDEWLRWARVELDRLLSEGDTGLLKIPEAFRQDLRSQVLGHLPAVAQWLATRPEGQVYTERSVDRVLDDLNIRIKGRIDRWETNADGQSVLIDFKTTDPKTLEKRLRLEERDLQLAVYAWLIGTDHAVTDARYVSLRRDGVVEVGLLSETSDAIADQADREIAEIKHRLTAILAHQPMTRDGLASDGKVCDQCSMRGVCRRDEMVISASLDDEESDDA